MKEMNYERKDKIVYNVKKNVIEKERKKNKKNKKDVMVSMNEQEKLNFINTLRN